MTTNRSAEELAMRGAVEVWGRMRWPDARVVHELVVTERRIDVAFIGTDHIVGIEIKSSKDRLDRLEDQVRTFERHLPEVWLAIAPKWDGAVRVSCCLTIDHDKITHVSTWRRGPNRAITVQMLDLLWRNELLAVASRQRVDHTARSRMTDLIAALARALTGDEIVREVCAELRGRDAFWKADPPILADIVAQHNLFGGATA